MGILVSCQSIGKSYSSRPLFREITFGIEDGERLGLIGPNGAGKSTLLKILSGSIEPDVGQVVRRKRLRVAHVEQQSELPLDATVFDIISRAALTDDSFEPYEIDAHIDTTLSTLGFSDREATVGSLSGGWRKRLAIGCALVKQPELLFMDEPTNHLDLEGILWLEKFLKNARFSYVVISHDRVFLEAVSNRIVELNPTYPLGFLSVQGNYSEFLISQEQALSAQAHLQQALASKVRREVAWLQRGARARQTKARGRIQDAGKLIEQLAEVKTRNSMTASIEIGFDASGRKTKELIVGKQIQKSLGGKMLLKDLSFILTSGIRMGLVGKNGSGKTTLLRMIVGELTPDSGSLKRANDLRIVWFDQNRQQLDITKSLKESLCPSGDSVFYRGRSMHIASWAKKFLFRPDQLNMPISYLSGGEQARILIANLMLKSADVLILDEPTNDLDIASLEVLEESLLDFPGAIILVTHDRMMLHSVANTILALDGNGHSETFADYEQCEEMLDRFMSINKGKSKQSASEKLDNSAEKYSRKNGSKSATSHGDSSSTADSKTIVTHTSDLISGSYAGINAGTSSSNTNGLKPKESRKAKATLSQSEKRELAELPKRIEKVEGQLVTIGAEMSAPSVAANYLRLQELEREHNFLEKELAALYKRWEELESRAL
jgi:ATP-binding cassette subfamily F protein uup